MQANKCLNENERQCCWSLCTQQHNNLQHALHKSVTFPFLPSRTRPHNAILFRQWNAIVTLLPYYYTPATLHRAFSNITSQSVIAILDIYNRDHVLTD